MSNSIRVYGLCVRNTHLFLIKRIVHNSHTCSWETIVSAVFMRVRCERENDSTS